MIAIPSVDNNETVVRILHKDWVVDGQLQKVQHQLLSLSTLEEHEISLSE